MISINTLNSQANDFGSQLQSLLQQQSALNDSVVSAVEKILDDVRDCGDRALLDYTKQFDRVDAADAAELKVSSQRLSQALNNIPAAQRQALEQAAERITTYAQRQKLASWEYMDALGNRLGQQVQPIERVGLYVPGGKAAYPSSVLMNAIPKTPKSLANFARRPVRREFR